ncbi:MAG: hypothetical protein TREMPRED_004243 [Tremellales sp. Tagirdzhanova-0007]|nr:MAG: hypothetical protein TREMPRED_004243 [Tremellales sp. Tagirdzhanova-0007]
MASSTSPDAVLHLAALHTLAQAGFASTSRAASLVLSSTVSRYIRLVGLACVEHANLAGRSKVAAIDVVEALDALGVGGVGDLHEWAVGLDKEVVFSGHFNRPEGTRGSDKGLVEMRLVHDDERGSFELDGDLEQMDVDEQELKPDLPDDAFELDLRLTPSDLSWLPPLPGHTPPLDVPPSLNTDGSTTISSIPALSIAERYRRATPYSQSQVSQAHPFIDVPHFPNPTALRPPSSSFSSLISTYEATASDPSIALRQTPLRQQAAELLRRSIATADPYSPIDTLVSAIQPPRSTPIVPSHSDILPQHLIPLDPDPTGLLASLVHQIHSPNLPPALRERLTSLRPPQPQVRDGMPILYGEPMRGGDDASLARARGKQPKSEDEAWLRATWDSGPRGIEKWGRGRLPTGRKVVQSGIGEDKPREPEGAGGSRTLKLKLNGENGPSPGAAPMNLDKVEKSPTPTGLGGTGTALGTGLKLRLGGLGMGRRESAEGVYGVSPWLEGEDKSVTATLDASGSIGISIIHPQSSQEGEGRSELHAKSKLPSTLSDVAVPFSPATATDGVASSGVEEGLEERGDRKH